ncbi:MAG: hypothetical protein FWG87_03955 [Defluviitaleaceae bacterium]|nr:hypothetical protein [Defluviitaleaceae bacterium]
MGGLPNFKKTPQTHKATKEKPKRKTREKGANVLTPEYQHKLQELRIEKELKVKIRNLMKVWKHIQGDDRSQLEALLSNAPKKTVENLHKIFCEDSSVVISYDKENDCRYEATETEDITVLLNDGWSLVINVRSVLCGYSETGIPQKELSLDEPKDISRQFVMLCKDFDKQKHLDFDYRIGELTFQ